MPHGFCDQYTTLTSQPTVYDPDLNVFYEDVTFLQSILSTVSGFQCVFFYLNSKPHANKEDIATH